VVLSCHGTPTKPAQKPGGGPRHRGKAARDGAGRGTRGARDAGGAGRGAGRRARARPGRRENERDGKSGGSKAFAAISSSVPKAARSLDGTLATLP